MSIVVKNGNVGVSASKVRLVANLIRNQKVENALKILRFEGKQEIAIVLTKLINSGLSIADQSDKYDLDNLVIETIFVDEGPTQKRIMPRAQGRAFRIRKRSSYVTIALKEA
jgi:large subunit ribosomal protein L22